MLLIIDNFDSFTYNLVQYFGELGADLRVFRNNELSADQARALHPSHVVFSPGPCTPNEAGRSLELIEAFSENTPILGVCLGHQCIGQHFGGRVIRAGTLMHGKTSPIRHTGKGVLHDLPSPLTAARYHSLVVERASLPDVLEITAESDDGEIMALRHRSLPIEGVQFHPESLATGEGKRILRNFLDS